MSEEYTPLVDYPDYTQEFAISAVLVDMIPVSIKAQTIDKIRIDIVAQSIGNIAVDIAAQTVGNISVDIAAQSVGNLAVDITAQTLSTLKIDIAAQTISQVDVNIAAQAVTLNVSVQGTANVNITDAIINISSLKLMDSGIIQRISSIVIGSIATLYTVPSGKKLYIYSAMLNAKHYAAGDHEASLYVYDGATSYYLITLSSPDSVEQMNEAIGFNVMSIPAGWEVRLYANGYTEAFGSIIGVEVSA